MFAGEVMLIRKEKGGAAIGTREGAGTTNHWFLEKSLWRLLQTNGFLHLVQLFPELWIIFVTCKLIKCSFGFLCKFGLFGGWFGISLGTLFGTWFVELAPFLKF